MRRIGAGRRLGHLGAALSAGIVLLGAASGVGAAPATEILSLDPALGPEIDRAERDRLGLFPDLADFRAGRFVRGEDGRIRLEYTAGEEGAIRDHSLIVSEEAFELTRLHVGHVAGLAARRAEDARDADLEARVLHRMALRYGLDRRWDLAVPLLEELRREHPGRFDALDLPPLLDDARRLRDSGRPLYISGSLLDRSGHTETLIFAGYYGIWLGFAIPIALGADSPEMFSLGLLVIPPASVAGAHYLTRHRRITEAQADLIGFSGHFGTWQALGWSVVADGDARDVVGVGTLGGLAGIVGGAMVGRRHDLSEGQVALLDAGMGWGAWLGLLAAQVTDWNEEDELFTSMLVGSDLGVAVGGLRAKSTRMTARRVRLMNLGGVLGATAGSGVMGLFGIDDQRAAFGILGAGSVVGAWLAIAWTRPDDRATGLASRAEPFVDVAAGLDGRPVPRVGVRLAWAGEGP